jgi:hypothetical protein
MVRGENKIQACDASLLGSGGSATLSVTVDCRIWCGDDSSLFQVHPPRMCKSELSGGAIEGGLRSAPRFVLGGS